MNTCVICQDEFEKQSSFKCTNVQCKINVCEPCIQKWDKIKSPNLKCPVCHTSRNKPDNDLIRIIQPYCRESVRDYLYSDYDFNRIIRNRVVYSDYVSNWSTNIIYEIKTSRNR